MFFPVPPQATRVRASVALLLSLGLFITGPSAQATTLLGRMFTDHLSPFGVRLMAPLPSGVTGQGNATPTDDGDRKRVVIHPPVPANDFWSYSAGLALQSEKVLDVFASKDFPDKDSCVGHMAAPAKKIMAGLYKEQQEAYLAALIFEEDKDQANYRRTSFVLSEIEAVPVFGDQFESAPVRQLLVVQLDGVNSEYGPAIAFVNVELGCVRNEAGLIERYGADAAQDLWLLYLRAESAVADEVALQEACQLNPQRADCPIRPSS
ncbi:MAG: hypothetical protein VW771_00295 [Gammaproteobacteria bacterium]